MSIDMQFSFLSNDLASAKQAEGKVRGTDGGCGDKGFGDVFEEQLQQAAESDAEQKAKKLLTGQEVAAMLHNTLPDDVNVDTVDIAAVVGGSEHIESGAGDTGAAAAALLLSQYQNSDATDEALPLSEDALAVADNHQASPSAANGSLSAKDSDSLFHLIAKSRDYAAGLETGESRAETKSGVAALSAQAALESVGLADDHGAPLIADAEAAELAEFMLLSAKKDGSAQQADTTKDAALAADLTKTSAAVKQALAEAEQAAAAESLAIAAEQQTQVASESANNKLTPEQQAIGPKTESLRQLLREAEPAAAVPTPTAAEHQADTSLQRPLSAEQSAAVMTTAETAGAEKAQASTAAAAPASSLQVTGNLSAEQAQATTAVTEQAELSGALLTPMLSANAPEKNNKTATVGFAEFQKAANAALAQQQKQQTQAEQQAGQPGTMPGESTDPDLTLAQPGVVVHDQPQLAGTLVATEKALGGAGFSQTGSQSGGQSQHQSQQGFSQILAAKQLDSQTQNQPALSLLEPTAANQLKERVMFQVNQKIQSADIRLAPEELGSVQIKINLQQEQLSVQFVVQQSAAKEALEQQMPRLKELLQEQGMALTDGQVHQQQQEQQSQQDDRRTASGRAGRGNPQDDEPEVAAQQVQIAVSDRMVDYYA